MERLNISGIIPPLVTPVTEGLELDKEALGTLIEHVIEGGVNGIFLLGTTGECASLNDEIRQEAISLAVSAVKGRIPVFINISTPSYLESLALAGYASAAGADYTVMAPPYYFDMNQEELMRYFELIADRSKVPLLLYNAPQYTKTAIEPETVRKLALHENIVGIKDSSGNMDYVHQLLKDRTDENFSIFIGPELLLGECVQLGCSGGVNGGANIFPKLFVNMYLASSRNKLDEMKKWQSLIAKVQEHVYDAADSPMGIVIGLKYALSAKGISTDQMLMPVYNKLSDEKKEKINDLIREMEAYDL
ncbi:dihydrodipicolinate synthase family protein [Bacteroidota bacterium]